MGWRRSPIHENICWWFLNRHKHLTGASKLRNCVFLGKCLKWNLSFQNWSKSLCLCVSGPTKRLTAQSTAAYALRNWQGKQEFVKENKKKRKKEKKYVHSLRYMDEFFFPNDLSIIESCQLYIIAKYKASNCYKIEAVIQRCSIK